MQQHKKRKLSKNNAHKIKEYKTNTKYFFRSLCFFLANPKWQTRAPCWAMCPVGLSIKQKCESETEHWMGNMIKMCVI